MAVGPPPLAAILLVCLLAAGPAFASKTQPKATVRALADAAYGDTLAALITNASQRIDLAMFLFKTSPASGNQPARLVRDLVAARQRGVKVRVILEYSSHDEALNRVKP